MQQTDVVNDKKTHAGTALLSTSRAETALITWVLKAHEPQQKKTKKSVSQSKIVLFTPFWNSNRINQEIGAFWENLILLFSNGVDFHPPVHFQRRRN